jgi:hypothetical protein
LHGVYGAGLSNNLKWKDVYHVFAEKWMGLVRVPGANFTLQSHKAGIFDTFRALSLRSQFVILKNHLTL